VTSSVVTSTFVACCQLAPQLGDPAGNRELAAAALDDAVRQGALVVVLPELMSSGYAGSAPPPVACRLTPQ
jgi:5-aminopentanamidase